MIAEFAFTPSVFHEEANPDAESWRDQLRELSHAMFPKTAPSPVMVANLWGGTWHNIALTNALAIADHKLKRLCVDLLSKIQGSLVPRPFVAQELPNEDRAWGMEAIWSHAIEPIDRVISCRAVQDAMTAEGHSVRCISEVHGDGFWRNISSQWDQPLNISSQIQAIRKLSVHAEFLCLVSPHVRGAGDDETAFATEMIRSAIQRPTGFGPVDIEIHSEGPDNPEAADFGSRLARLASNTSTALVSALRPGQSVRLVLWPKLLDRYLIAGAYTYSSKGKKSRRARWGISMQHIARRNDDREDKPSTSWSLLGPKQLRDVFDRYCTGAPKDTLFDTVVNGH